MISIQASISDMYTLEPMAFEKIYVEILNEKGVPVWPLTLVENDSATISKLISTADMEPGQKYTVRVTPSTSMSPMGQAEFEISKEGISPALLIPGLALIPEILLQHPKPEDEINPPPGPITISWLIYVTQRDSKVCKFCSPHDGERFRPDDPEMVKIPLHPNCRCHYDIISHEEEKEIYQAYFLGRLMEKYNGELAIKSYLAARSVTHAKNPLPDNGRAKPSP